MKQVFQKRRHPFLFRPSGDLSTSASVKHILGLEHIYYFVRCFNRISRPINASEIPFHGRHGEGDIYTWTLMNPTYHQLRKDPAWYAQENAPDNIWGTLTVQGLHASGVPNPQRTTWLLGFSQRWYVSFLFLACPYTFSLRIQPLCAHILLFSWHPKDLRSLPETEILWCNHWFGQSRRIFQRNLRAVRRYHWFLHVVNQDEHFDETFVLYWKVIGSSHMANQDGTRGEAFVLYWKVIGSNRIANQERHFRPNTRATLRDYQVF